MSDEWFERKQPKTLEKRYSFPNYSSLREFLDKAAELSEKEGLYPDMGFGTDYVNVTIHADEGATEMSSGQRKFSEQLVELFNS